MDAMKPPLTVLVKLGSIAVHAEEILSPGGHDFDIQAIKTLLDDPEVKDWLNQMGQMAFLPIKR